MVNQSLCHTMFFMLGILVIATVLKYDLNETIWQKSQKEITQKKADYKTVITEEELKKFMRLWPEFYQMGMDKDFIISSQIEHPDKIVKWQSRVWFIYHHMDPARFFYIQQRIDYLLNAIEIRRNAQALIDRLSKNKNSDKNSVTKDMIAFQRKLYAAEKFSEEEQQLMDLYGKDLKIMIKRFPFTNLGSS